jgi:hypothetical protein
MKIILIIIIIIKKKKKNIKREKVANQVSGGHASLIWIPIETMSDQECEVFVPILSQR